MEGYSDKLVEALDFAVDIWEKSLLAGKIEKLGYAGQLHRFAVFSLPQIAKIVRVPSRYIYEEFRPNGAKGGRFDPQTLSTLARIRRLQIEGKKIPDRLIRLGIEGGTSFTCITALTKISYSKYYELARETTAKQVESPVVPQTRENILALRERGLTQVEIAHATGLDQPRVSRILRGQR